MLDPAIPIAHPPNSPLLLNPLSTFLLLAKRLGPPTAFAAADRCISTRRKKKKEKKIQEEQKIGIQTRPEL